MLSRSVLLIVSALFPIVDPIGSAPVFLSLTRNHELLTHRLLARRIAFNSFVLLIAAFTIGSHVLLFFGISLPMVQVGGGLIVVFSGWDLLKQKNSESRANVTSTDIFLEAFYPLTLPLTVGPGSIAVAITLGANTMHSLGGGLVSIVAAVIGSAMIAISIYLCYAYADRLERFVGPTGTFVIVKLTAFLLVCVGLQIMWNGASQLVRSLLQSV